MLTILLDICIPASCGSRSINGIQIIQKCENQNSAVTASCIHAAERDRQRASVTVEAMCGSRSVMVEGASAGKVLITSWALQSVGASLLCVTSLTVWHPRWHPLDALPCVLEEEDSPVLWDTSAVSPPPPSQRNWCQWHLPEWDSDKLEIINSNAI